MKEIRNFDISQMVGRAAKKINVLVDAQGSSELEFIFEDGMKVLFHHEYQCCESVFIESIVGRLCDLIGEPLVVAEEVSNEVNEDSDLELESRWTFYKFDTIRGGVTIRWVGESNGYYSTEVNITAEIGEE